jgi:hypothetical protein
MQNILEAIKIIIIASIFFVWVVRYQNIIQEFKHYQLPDWLRDLVGILKLSFALMIQSSNTSLILIGSGGIALLMVAALLTHVKVKNPPPKMLPALSLLVLCSWIFFSTFTL